MTSPRAALLPSPPPEAPERERRPEGTRAILPDRDRVLLLARRQCLLIELAALEDYLGLERTKPPHHNRMPREELERRREESMPRL